MAQAREETKGLSISAAPAATPPVDGDGGGAREAGEKRLEQSSTGTRVPVLLTKDDLRLIGKTLNGAHWQADIAALIGCSKSQVTRFLNGQRELNHLVPEHLQYVICERMVQLAELLHVPGMPYEGSAKADIFIEEIRRLVGDVPGMEPPRDEP